MTFSVIVPTCARWNALAACLERLAPSAQSLEAVHYQVIVTDDGRLNEQIEALITEKFPWAQWTAGPRRGPASNRNHGASKAEGDVLVFLDDDCLPEVGLLEEYARVFEHDPDLGAAEGRIVADREPVRFDEVAPVNVTGGLFWSCNVAVRASLFRRLGGFDERFPDAAMEDVELRCRLRRLKRTPLFVPAATVVHPLRRMGGWRAIRQQASAHGLYVRIETTDLAPFTWNYAARLFARTWVKGILLNFWRYRGRGFWSMARASTTPFFCAREMKRAARLPRLQTWSGTRTLGQ
jgi:GT2 family glycosyltransferase